MPGTSPGLSPVYFDRSDLATTDVAFFMEAVSLSVTAVVGLRLRPAPRPPYLGRQYLVQERLHSTPMRPVPTMSPVKTSCCAVASVREQRAYAGGNDARQCLDSVSRPNDTALSNWIREDNATHESEFCCKRRPKLSRGCRETEWSDESGEAGCARWSDPGVAGRREERGLCARALFCGFKRATATDVVVRRG